MTNTETLCWKCKKSPECDYPFPVEQCSSFINRLTAPEQEAYLIGFTEGYNEARKQYGKE